MELFELTPRNGRKSFYGKAQVAINQDGTQTLFSYGTAIMTRQTDGTYVKHWDGWSATTGNHIASFSGGNKKEYQIIPYVTYKR